MKKIAELNREEVLRKVQGIFRTVGSTSPEKTKRKALASLLLLFLSSIERDDSSERCRK